MERWKKVLALIDAMPERERRFARGFAWSPKQDCGCVFGTLYPETPHHYVVRFDFGYVAKNPHLKTKGSWADGFLDWVAAIGLHPTEVDDLQYVNDYGDPKLAQGPDDCVARWRVVRRYVDLRAQGNVHGAAVHQMEQEAQA